MNLLDLSPESVSLDDVKVLACRVDFYRIL